jgi:hypothetical protein
MFTAYVDFDLAFFVDVNSYNQLCQLANGQFKSLFL